MFLQFVPRKAKCFLNVSDVQLLKIGLKSGANIQLKRMNLRETSFRQTKETKRWDNAHIGAD